MARERVPVHHRAAEQHIDDVAVLVASAGALRDLQNVTRLLHHALADEKSGGEFFIMTRRAHDHGHAAAFHADFERLLTRRDIRHLTHAAMGGEFAYSHLGDGVAAHVTRSP